MSVLPEKDWIGPLSMDSEALGIGDFDSSLTEFGDAVRGWKLSFDCLHLLSGRPFLVNRGE